MSTFHWCVLLKGAVITYSTNATVHWTLDDEITMSREKLVKAVGDLPRGARFTNTPEAMEKADELVLVPPGDE